MNSVTPVDGVAALEIVDAQVYMGALWDLIGLIGPGTRNELEQKGLTPQNLAETMVGSHVSPGRGS